MSEVTPTTRTKLVEHIGLDLFSREGEVSIGLAEDGKHYLITGADTYGNREVWEGLGSTNQIEITERAYHALAESIVITKPIKL